MAWGSEKQLAFFKKMADRYKLCSTPGPDVFEHAIRMNRAVKTAKAMRERLRKTRATRHQDTFARRQGYKSYADLMAANWQPHITANAWRKKVRDSQKSSRPSRKGILSKGRKTENPFKRSDRVEYRG